MILMVKVRMLASSHKVTCVCRSSEHRIAWPVRLLLALYMFTVDCRSEQGVVGVHVYMSSCLLDMECPYACEKLCVPTIHSTANPLLCVHRADLRCLILPHACRVADIGSRGRSRLGRRSAAHLRGLERPERRPRASQAPLVRAEPRRDHGMLTARAIWHAAESARPAAKASQRKRACCGRSVRAAVRAPGPSGPTSRRAPRSRALTRA